MFHLPAFSARDRLLVIAPHPDDETLATGGLIQKAIAAGACVRVVFVTDGDNNPWPQRFLEKRWQITLADRERWGARRRREAMTALQCLGLGPDSVTFLGFPDQGLKRLLMATDEAPTVALASQIDSWRPTVLVSPSGADRHPDHGAAWVYTELALARLCSDEPFQRLEYLVHYPNRERLRGNTCVTLNYREQALKHSAILCHATQVALSRRRFTAYASETESYFDPAYPPGHLVVRADCLEGVVRLRVKVHRWTILSALAGSCTLALVLEGRDSGSHCWTLSLPLTSQKVVLRNAVTGERLHEAAVWIRGGYADCSLPVQTMDPLKHAFVSLQYPRAFFEPAGWRRIELREAPSRNTQQLSIRSVHSVTN